MMKKEKVIVIVKYGFAEVIEQPRNVSVEIRDYDHSEEISLSPEEINDNDEDFGVDEDGEIYLKTIVE